MPDPRIQKLAKVLVNYSLALQPGQQLSIRTNPLAQDLALAAYSEAILAGAHVFPQISLPGFDEIYFKHASDEQLDFISPIRKMIVEKFDAHLVIGAEYTDTRALSGVDPERLARFRKASALTADAPTPVAPPWTPTPIPSAEQLLRDNLRRRRVELGRGWSGIVHPGTTLGQARQALPAWREVLTERRSPRTSINRPVGTGRRLAIVRSRLDLTKEIAHAHHAKVNDVVLPAVAGGLRALLVSRGEDVRGLTQRAMVNISLHEEQPWEAQGNKPGWMMVPLPIGEPDPVRRLERIAAETAARKRKANSRLSTGTCKTLILFESIRKRQVVILIKTAKERIPP